MRKFFTFPNPVNEVAARVVAGGVVAMSLAVLLTRQGWILAPLTVGFLLRVLAGPRLSPLGRLAVHVVAPRLRREPKLVPGPPKRFAQTVGLVFSATASLLWVSHSTSAALVVVALLTVAASLEAFVGLCLGCVMFAQLMRLGVIPEKVCAECSNINLRGVAKV